MQELFQYLSISINYKGKDDMNCRNVKYKRPSLFADLVFAVLTIRGSESRGKQQIIREYTQF
jgi:hypothetical protein